LFARVLIAASPVGVYLDFEAPPSEAAVAAMRKETATILDRVDIQIAWRQVSENQGNEPFERLAVVKFTGKCACGGFLPATSFAIVAATRSVQELKGRFQSKRRKPVTIEEMNAAIAKRATGLR